MKGMCCMCGTECTYVSGSGGMCVACYNDNVNDKVIVPERSTEEIAGKALSKAKDAFYDVFASEGLDGAYFAFRIECYELSSDLKDVISTTTYDNIERKLTK